MTKQRETVFQVSTNRSRASHRVRYVESSAPPEGECRLCVGTLTEKPKKNEAEKEND
ncbi:hypothetical protein [Aliidiomarina sp. B3213]|uniref:hypothetical protein n=1 Tax=Aliidiomarina sp. B3213 TaxID=2249757 RepID=UPI001403118F|nr:hypothetical protein [Aliidiomarina sp. B3213]